MPFFNRRFLALLLLLPLAGTGNAQLPLTASLPQLSSVGKLHVPGQRYENGYVKHYDESCSATLITGDPEATSSLFILSAWHCIELYRDTSKPLTFETANGETRLANLVTSGGSMYSDWALLRLHTPLPSPALLTAPKGRISEALVMAGYPRSRSPQALRQQSVSGCRVTGLDGADTRSDCVLQRGASGGAVFSDDKDATYLGVISRGDGESQSIYVPLARFHATISAYLENGQLP